MRDRQNIELVRKDIEPLYKEDKSSRITCLYSETLTPEASRA